MLYVLVNKDPPETALSLSLGPLTGGGGANVAFRFLGMAMSPVAIFAKMRRQHSLAAVLIFSSQLQPT